ncbi:GFA family protein [Lutibaculum baratangense]|uniref:CENP-V/GFA domain-containing protein n=1 Tax=Lutibaculum baratangense AMV1 TaxID=631454 RepID=V4RQH2_9HYPH|nr:GFA family protein [Lutibaculum baratangense]ESR27504.1 hypothetical protein N177_0027 [Lutibaculum baratangense AMV1]
MTTGGCSCGAVRYRLDGPPMFVHCCHCRDCQRQTGSGFVVNALIESSHVQLIAGKPQPVTVPTESGYPHDILRCPECRVAAWSDYGRRGTMIFLRVGTLDEPVTITPDVHIYTRSKLPWVALPPGVPAFAEYYEIEALWPAESLRRRAALNMKR